MDSAGDELERIIVDLSAADSKEEKISILKSLMKDEDSAQQIEAFICDEDKNGDQNAADDDGAADPKEADPKEGGSADDFDDEYYLNLVLLLVAVLERKLDWATYLIQKRDVDPRHHLRFMLNRGCHGNALFLIEAGADVNSLSDKHKCELLATVVCAGNGKYMEILMAAGADMNATDIKGNTPLMLAMINGYKKTMDLLIGSTRGTDDNLLDKNGNPGVPDEKIFLECVKSLIEAGADVNQPNEKKYTPLMYAKADSLEVLLSAGADVNAANTNGVTALMLNAMRGDSVSTLRLLEAGADVNSADRMGETALSRALFFGHTDCVKLMIDAGADVNAANNAGDTALMTAALGGHPEMVRILLEAGAMVHNTNTRGQNALTCHVAQCKNLSKDLASMLIAAGEVLYLSRRDEQNHSKTYVARFSSKGVTSQIKVPEVILNNRLFHYKMLKMDCEDKDGAGDGADVNKTFSFDSQRKNKGDQNSNAPETQLHRFITTESDEERAREGNAGDFVLETDDEANTGDDVIDNSQKLVTEGVTVVAESDNEEDTDVKDAEATLTEDRGKNKDGEITKETGVEDDAAPVKVCSHSQTTSHNKDEKDVNDINNNSNNDNSCRHPFMEADVCNKNFVTSTPKKLKDAQCSGGSKAKSTSKEASMARAATVELMDENSQFVRQNEEATAGTEQNEATSSTGPRGKRSYSDAFGNDVDNAENSKDDVINISISSESDSGVMADVEETLESENSSSEKEPPKKRFRCIIM